MWDRAPHTSMHVRMYPLITRIGIRRSTVHTGEFVIYTVVTVAAQGYQG